MKVEVRQLENTFPQFAVTLCGLAMLQRGTLVFETTGDVELVSAYSGYHEYELSVSRFVLRIRKTNNHFSSLAATIDAAGNTGGIHLVQELSELIDVDGEDILESNPCNVLLEPITEDAKGNR